MGWGPWTKGGASTEGKGLGLGKAQIWAGSGFGSEIRSEGFRSGEPSVRLGSWVLGPREGTGKGGKGEGSMESDSDPGGVSWTNTPSSSGSDFT